MEEKESAEPKKEEFLFINCRRLFLFSHASYSKVFFLCVCVCVRGIGGGGGGISPLSPGRQV